MSSKIRIAKDLEIPVSELKFKFSRSGGHGGQNVNKVETKVELLFDVVNSSALDIEQKERILRELASRIDELGILHIVSQGSRYQSRNRQDAIERLIYLIREALTLKKKRLVTKPTVEGKEKRIRSKKKRSRIKQMRCKNLEF